MFSLNTIKIRFISKAVKNAFRKFSSPAERQVQINKVNINYVQSGNGEKTVLLMPGALGSSWTDFTPQIQHLPQLLPGYSIVAWDPPGYGRSTPPLRKFSVNFYHEDAQIAQEFMKTIGFDRYSVLGWSDGGIIGMILASEFPQNVEKLVVWGSNAYILPEELKIYEQTRDVSKWSAKMRAPMEKVYGAKEFAKLWSDWVDVILEIYKEKDGDLCKAHLSKISAPMMILHGCKDPMLAAEHVPYLRKNIKHAKYYEFPDGKHNIHLRYAEEFNRKVADFIKE